MPPKIIKTYPNNQTTIEPTKPYIFDKHIKIENHIQTIEAKAFQNARYLLDVELPENIKTLPERVFDRSRHLKKINLEHVTEIGDAAFKDCRKLTTLDLSNTTHIGRHAFSDCTELSDIKMSDNLSEIGAYAFENTSIVTIALPDGLKIIPKGLFQNCKLLTSVVLPDSIEVIEANAFANCQNLTFVNPLPKALKHIDHTAFDSPGVVFNRIRKNSIDTTLDTTPERCNRLFNQTIDPELFCKVIPVKYDHDDDVDTLDVGVSVIYRLHKFGIHTIKDLLKYNRQQLIQQKIAGVAATEHIQQALVLKNLTLPDNTSHEQEVLLGGPSLPKPDRSQVAKWIDEVGQTRLNEFDQQTQLNNIFDKKLERSQLFEQLIALRQEYATICNFAFVCKTITLFKSKTLQHQLYDEIIKRLEKSPKQESELKKDEN